MAGRTRDGWRAGPDGPSAGRAQATAVPGAGLEPARECLPGDFKSPVYTDFTTPAVTQ